MLINGVDLSSLGVQLYNRVLTSNNIKTTRDWLEGDIQPTLIRQQEKFKSIQLQFLVTEKNEDDAFLVMSKLTSMLKKATVVFDDIDLLFDVTITGPTQQKRLKNGNFILTVDLISDYAKGQTEVYTTNQKATNYFKLRILYYQNGNVLISTDEVVIRSSDFDLVNTYESLGINLNKYKPDYYNGGQVTNFGGRELTYENLYALQTLIINYSPVVYTKGVEYFVKGDDETLNSVQNTTITFTKAQVDAARNLGELIDFNAYKPDGYYASTNFTGDFTFDNLLSFTPLQIYFEKIENEPTKNITITYNRQNADGTYSVVGSNVVTVRQSDVVLGSRLKNFVNLNRYKPESHYDSGYLKTDDYEASVTYADLKAAYDVYYDRTEYTVFVEYYYGTYPNWNRITTSSYKFKYDSSYEDSVNIIQTLGIDVDKYKTETYEAGNIYQEHYETFDDVVNIGVVQIYYRPKDYSLTIEYLNDEDQVIQSTQILINETMFFNDPSLAAVIDLNAARPEGYIFDEERSYTGAVTLGSLLANAPIHVYYKPVEAVRTKSIVIRYKQELASTFSTINTSIITIEEAQVGGGVRLGDLFNLNAYRPEYYDNGILNGVSASSIFTFDEIQGEYIVLYMASQYSTQVRYYTDEIENENWIGSEQLRYTVLDFGTETTLVDLGLNINAFKPSYCDDGEIQYTGPVNFSALRNLDSIDIVYNSIAEPIDPDGIDYPHRILFLQHNDMGNFEGDYPNWTLNHAYINTGVTCSDMSKLTVLVDTYRVFDTEPLYNVNVGDAYLFGSITPNGSYYIKYVNNTKFKDERELTGINTFNVAAGLGTPELVLEETTSEGFSANTGITASTRDGYSYGTLTFTHLVQSNSARMDVPLYLFACDMNGYYRGGIAGVGIKSCKIYYDNTLIRDFVPVTFFDKIGDKIAPSNCLYDKITQSFFEDATGLNSFNIMDDPAYEDTNPEHNLGCCYANYYQDGTLFNSSTIWFRESDFVNGNTWDPYTKLFVDYLQPKYANAGVISNLNALGDITFNNVKNFIFIINYAITDYRFTVRYWKDNTEDENNLLGEEELSINERNFYSVPTFGDIVDIQKYKPDNYKPTYNYPETRVTLSRILEHAPYDIVYQEVENPEVYTTTIRYYRKHYTTNSTLFTANWLEIGTREVEIDETQFAEGVYIEKFLDLDALKPTSAVEGVEFYADGEPYNWYLQDEMLDTPEKLRAEYQVVYDTVSVPIEVRYYTDQVDEDNQVASAIWNIKLSDWPDGGMFYLTDELPNKFINAYKPVICWGGELVNPSQQYTVQSLAELGHVDIIYRTKEEPHDPDSTDFPQKVLWFKKDTKDWQHLPTYIPGLNAGPGGIDGAGDSDTDPHRIEKNTNTPYLNLGYTPKEIGRLRTELKGYCGNAGISNIAGSWSYATDDFESFFGYTSAVDNKEIYEKQGDGTKGAYTIGVAAKQASYGDFTYRGHTIGGGFIVYTNPGPQGYDGHAGFNLNKGALNDGFDLESVREMSMSFRRGKNKIKDIDLNNIVIYPTYIARMYSGYGVYDDMNYHEHADPNGSAWRLPAEREEWAVKETPSGNPVYVPGVIFNPITGTMDAYNGYFEMYDYETSNNPEIKQTLENKDTDIFEYRGKPKGPLTLFVTTNPDTGTLNWLPSPNMAYMGFMGGGAGASLQAAASGDPYSPDFDGTVTYQEMVIIDVTEDGTPIYQNKSTSKSYAYANFHFSGCPVPCRAMIWYLKIWDRNRLVRDLIPVAKGDQIYDFIAPANGLFDKVTEIFFTNENDGGTYKVPRLATRGRFLGYRDEIVTAEQVVELRCSDDPTIWGKIVVNYYDNNNNFLGNQYVTIPVHYNEANESMADLLHNNDFKPNDFYHDGMIDVDGQLKDINRYLNDQYEAEEEDRFLKDIYENGALNIFYKQRTFTKTVVYYRGNTRVASKDLFFSLDDINAATSLADLGLELDLYQTEDYKPGRLVFNEQILVDKDIKAFIDAPSPIVVYDEFSVEEKPDLLYVTYYRGGAYDSTEISLNPDNSNYLDCDLAGRVMNPNGAIKYINHYHTALYEDEAQDYFIAYQVKVDYKYVDIHKGPGRAYATLATITDEGVYTIIEENRGWGRLREYPTGWILLSYTSPMVGPGQNPSFEIGGLGDVTVPFGTILSFNKMTVDRLWAYSPDEASWIKTEEISMNEEGKLFNALGTQVIHLDEISDWSGISSFNGIGVSVNAYRLKYHDNAEYNYQGGFNYTDLSALHSLDIVYPETIYEYNVYYYKDTLTPQIIDEGELETPGLGAVKKLSDQDSGTSRHMYESPSINSRVLKEIPAAYNQATQTEVNVLLEDYPAGWWRISYEGTEGYIQARYIEEIQGPTFSVQPTWFDPTVGVASFTCSMSDWNPDWDIFIETSWQYDDNDDPINPTLYRDTPLTLTWEFFGIDRNLYKPLGSYDDGLFLWNPRTWNNEDVYFTFEELVTTGTQSVIYLPTLDHYKAAYYLGFTEIPLEIDDFSTKPKTNKDGRWDIEYKYERRFAWRPQADTHVEFDFRDRPGLLKDDCIRKTFGVFVGGGNVVEKTETYVTNNRTQNDEYYSIINFSNKRNASAVWAEGNDLTNYQSNYKIGSTQITENLNLENPEFYTFTYDQQNSTKPEYEILSMGSQKVGAMRTYITSDYWTTTMHGSSYWFYQSVKEVEKPYVYYYIKVWEDYYLKHYFIPLPKGYYLPNGTQVPYNTFYDVITGELCETTKVPYHSSHNPSEGYVTAYSPEGYPQIFRVGEPIVKDNQFDYFGTWNNYSVDDVDYITQITTATTSHKDPDALAIERNNLEVDLVVPVKGVTADAANKVIGEWYKVYDNSWFKSSDATILPSGTYTITPCDKYIALKDTSEHEGTRNQAITYFGYLNPGGDRATTSVTTETAAHATAEHEDMYFIGNTWWPKSATEDNAEDIEVRYAVSADRLPVYSIPIAKDEYKVDMLLSGARITATKKLTYDNYWQYIGTGWVDTENNVSEVI